MVHHRARDVAAAPRSSPALTARRLRSRRCARGPRRGEWSGPGARRRAPGYFGRVTATAIEPRAETAEPTAARTAALGCWLVLGAAAVVLVVHALAYRFVTDDAYISF